jgi:predicted nuclease of predicted toxin-antitoxin system
MKLLFDHNLSPKLVNQLNKLFPESNHVFAIGLAEADDRVIWEYAKENNFVIVTKDADYSDLSILFGSPPKTIWIRRGNCRTNDIAELLQEHYEAIETLVETEKHVLTLF